MFNLLQSLLSFLGFTSSKTSITLLFSTKITPPPSTEGLFGDVRLQKYDNYLILQKNFGKMFAGIGGYMQKPFTNAIYDKGHE